MTICPFPTSQAERVKPLWALDPSVIFLNHGSFGACPRVVLEAQRRLRDRIESEPVRFFVRELEGLHEEARSSLAHFLGTTPENLASIPNATTGVNTVLRSIKLSAGDEILTTDHAYNACRNALDFIAHINGARVVVANVPFPLSSSDEVLESVLAKTGPRTRLAMIDHVTSQSGLIFPIQRIVSELAQRGIDTLVDGAHAPGMVPLNLKELGAAYYTGNCHKWMCTPKGAAFLYVRPDKQDSIRPLVISHGANSLRKDKTRFQLEFDWTGTADPTAFLVIPEAIRFLSTLMPGGWSELAEHNRKMVLAGRRLLCDTLEQTPPAPENMIGFLATVPIPSNAWNALPHSSALDPLQDELFFKHGIEVPVFSFPSPSQKALRISAQIYNDEKDYQALAFALRKR